MRGWTEQPQSPSHHPNVFQCDAPLCGAYVRVQRGDDRREQHDREFHLLRLESSGGGQFGYDIMLDGNPIGDVRLKRQTYNLVRYIVSEKWVARLRGSPDVGGHDRLVDTMQDVLSESGAKAWGRGKNPKVWHYPEQR